MSGEQHRQLWQEARRILLTRVSFLEVIKEGKEGESCEKQFRARLKRHGILRHPDWNRHVKEERGRENIKGDHECLKLTAKGHRNLRRLRKEAEEKGFLP